MGKDQELLEAARNGNIAVVEKILNQRAKRSGPLASLRRGPGANVQDSSGYSALHHAALNGHKDIVELLLSHEASTNIVDVKGSSPLHLAAWTGNIEIVRLLLKHGPSVPNIDLTTKDNETALHCAAHFGHTEVVAHLLKQGCDASIRNAREETALDLAAQYGRLETVELLVRTHPELIQPYAKGECPPLLFPHTPLHLASRNGHKAVVAVLLAAGLDVNVRTSGGTALHEAALCGKVEVVRTLLDEGVDLAIRDSHHNTVMDLLGQFPPHVTHDITAIIKKHRGLSGPGDVDENGHNPLPPIPVPDPSLGSPYENVRTSQRSSSSHHSRVPPGVDSSSPGTSPTHWDFYHHHAKTRGGTTSAMSVTSDSSVYQTPPYPKSLMESSFRSEELPMYYGRDPDQMSVSSTASSTGGRAGRGLEPSPGSTSSTGGPSPRDRRFTGPDMSPGVYMTMGPGPGYVHQSHRSHSPGSTSKVSPTPPKKPPRRNLSVSPTHPAHLMTMSADGNALGPGDNNYEYLFLARSGVRSHSDLEELQGIGTQTLGGRREAHLRRGRSQDQYVDMKVRQSYADSPETYHFHDENPPQRKNVVHQPIAITASFGNYAIRTTNPRRKLRRHNHDRNYENSEPTHRFEVSKEFMNSVAPIEPIFVSNAYITLKSSQESLLEEGGVGRIRKLKVLPTSPTHYQQPPTPDHPPPSAMQAEKSIHERIRPLSQEYKRRSRDIETETDEDLLLFPSLEDASSGSLSSSVSLSDKSLSTDNNVEEYVGDAPFAGKSAASLGHFALQLCEDYDDGGLLSSLVWRLEDSPLLSRRGQDLGTVMLYDNARLGGLPRPVQRDATLKGRSFSMPEGRAMCEDLYVEPDPIPRYSCTCYNVNDELCPTSVVADSKDGTLKAGRSANSWEGSRYANPAQLRKEVGPKVDRSKKPIHYVHREELYDVIWDDKRVAAKDGIVRVNRPGEALEDDAERLYCNVDVVGNSDTDLQVDASNQSVDKNVASAVPEVSNSDFQTDDKGVVEKGSHIVNMSSEVDEKIVFDACSSSNSSNSSAVSKGDTLQADCTKSSSNDGRSRCEAKYTNIEIKTDKAKVGTKVSRNVVLVESEAPGCEASYSNVDLGGASKERCGCKRLHSKGDSAGEGECPCGDRASVYSNVDLGGASKERCGCKRLHSKGDSAGEGECPCGDRESVYSNVDVGGASKERCGCKRLHSKGDSAGEGECPCGDRESVYSNAQTCAACLAGQEVGCLSAACDVTRNSGKFPVSSRLEREASCGSGKGDASLPALCSNTLTLKI